MSDEIVVTIRVGEFDLTRTYVGTENTNDVTMWGERTVDMLTAIDQVREESFNDHKHD